MKKFEENVTKVMDFLKENEYKSSYVAAHKSCYNDLREFIESRGGGYTPQSGIDWIEKLKPTLSKNKKATYTCAMAKLNDIYSHGEIHRLNATKGNATYTKLCEEFKNEIDLYIEHCSNIYSHNYIPCIKARCARLLIFVQEKNCCSISDISCNMVKEFHQNYYYDCQQEKSMCEAVAIVFLQYLAKMKKLSYLPSVYFWYIKSYPRDPLPDVDTLTDIERNMIYQNPDDNFDTNYFWEVCTNFMDDYKDAGYSKTMRSICTRTLVVYFVFLATNSLSHKIDTAFIWLENSLRTDSTMWCGAKRILLLLDDYLGNGLLNLTAFYRDSQDRVLLSPEWCHDIIRTFLNLKEYEGKKKSTVCMYKSSIVRFCIYLGDTGITEFSQVSANTLKGFNAFDRHITNEGKNAYNVRIRKFLIYLGSKGYLTNPMLYLALPTAYAPSDQPVVILKQIEIDQINLYHKKAETEIELRRSAMLLLGLNMGLRQSDIINLKLNDIDWKKSTIHFLQEKTQVEIELPIMTIVGNALYRYLVYGRPKTESVYVFVNSRTPHMNLSRSTCGDALNSGIPDRDVSGSGFHVTRKTFATRMLRGGANADNISNALGHQGNKAVHKYLSLDNERMQLCALSLDEAGIIMKGGFLHV